MIAALAFLAVALGVAGLVELLPDRRPRIRLLKAFGPRGAPRDLEARILAAGSPVGPRELMAAKLLGAVGGALAGTTLATLAPGRLGVLLLIAAPVAGFLAPDLWLARRTRARFAEARRTLPALIELLGVTVGAGLTPAAALAAVGERSSGPLAEGWRALGREVALGVPLDQALAALEARLPMPEVETLGAALRRATRHGAPLTGALAALARDARLERRRRIQEEAARAAPKIQLVVALLLVPSVMLLVAAALAAALLDGGQVSVGS